MAIRLDILRDFRSRLTAGSRLPLIIISTGVCSTLAVFGLSIAGPEIVGGSPAGAAESRSYVPDMNDLLDERSPGARRYGWLTDSKVRIGLSDPVERVLSSGRRRPVVGMPGESLPGAATLVPLTALPDTGIPAADVAELGDLGTFDGAATSVGGPALGGVFPGGGGGIGGGGTDGSSNGPDPAAALPLTPSAPVPEPMTWGMLVLGFAFVGSAMRRREGVAAVLR